MDTDIQSSPIVRASAAILIVVAVGFLISLMHPDPDLSAKIKYPTDTPAHAAISSPPAIKSALSPRVAEAALSDAENPGSHAAEAVEKHTSMAQMKAVENPYFHSPKQNDANSASSPVPTGPVAGQASQAQTSTQDGENTLRFTCTPRPTPEPLVPFKGGALEGDEKAYRLLQNLSAPYKTVRKEITYSKSGWGIKAVQANGEVKNFHDEFDITDFSTVEGVKTFHTLEWRASDRPSGYRKDAAKLKLAGSDQAILYEWQWYPAPMDCSVYDFDHRSCRSPLLEPTDEDLTVYDCKQAR